MARVAPLKASFLAYAILIFLFSTLFLWKLSPPWAFTLCILSIIMIIASFISLTYSESVEELEEK